MDSPIELPDDTIIEFGSYQAHFGTIRLVLNEVELPVTLENIGRLFRTSIEIQENTREGDEMKLP